MTVGRRRELAHAPGVWFYVIDGSNVRHCSHRNEPSRAAAKADVADGQFQVAREMRAIGHHSSCFAAFFQRLISPTRGGKRILL
jgi:hypothetical protein